MKTSDDDKLEGAIKKVKGTVNEAVGQATDNPKLEGQGKKEKAEGAIQNKVGDIKKVFNR